MAVRRRRKFMKGHGSKGNSGDERLLSRDEWGEAQDIQGSSELILNSPIINKAQERILDQFTPKHPIAFVSPCTSTRPYTKSWKWKIFKKELTGVDFIVSSNAGIIPLEYEDSYPYLTYDARHDPMFDDLYLIYTMRSLIRFFTLKHYEYVVFNFRPSPHVMRRRKSGVVAGRYLKEHHHIQDYAVCPSKPVLKNALKAISGRKGFYDRMYPDVHPLVLDDMKDIIEKFKQ